MNATVELMNTTIRRQVIEMFLLKNNVKRKVFSDKANKLMREISKLSKDDGH